MDKKILAIILSVAAVLSAISYFFFSEAGILPEISFKYKTSPPELLTDSQGHDIKEDYIPEEILIEANSNGEDSETGSQADETTTDSSADYKSEPAPAAGLSVDDLSLWKLIVVNADHPLSRDFKVDLVKTNNGYLVDQRIYGALEAMIRDSAKDGVTLTVCSAFRTVKSQKALIEKKAQSLIVSGLDADIAYSTAGSYIAQPGESEHHTGLAVDLITKGISKLDSSFTKTDAYTWLTANAYRYGFILRYPKGKEEITHMSFEPWHYRYVGREYAAAIKASGLCLDEYLDTAK
jgi:D-alanyl-D-alanine carboxypeptidase